MNGNQQKHVITDIREHHYYLNKEKLSVVMPAYNEASHIYTNLMKTAEILDHFTSFEIIAVNDGSKDTTLAEMKRAETDNPAIHVVSYSNNHGKGYAIKTGIAHATGSYIAFVDSDLDLSPILLYDFADAMIIHHADIVIGSKLHKQSKIDYPLKRKIMSYGYYLILRILFHLRIKDTQTGIKLYKSSVIKPIVADMETYGYAFDIEILATANQMGYKIVERPVTLVFTRAAENDTSRIGIRDIMQTFKDTLAIRKRVHAKKTK